jgi:hypothetical protein
MPKLFYYQSVFPAAQLVSRAVIIPVSVSDNRNMVRAAKPIQTDVVIGAVISSPPPPSGIYPQVTIIPAGEQSTGNVIAMMVPI